MELSTEEECALRELVCVYESGADVRDFIQKNLNKHRREKEKRAEKWSERRFTIFMAFLAFALSVLASWILSSCHIDAAIDALMTSTT